MFQSVMFDFGSFPDASPGRVDRWSGLPWPESWSHGSGSGPENVLAHEVMTFRQRSPGSRVRISVKTL